MKIRFWGVRGSIPSPLRPEEVEEKICRAILGLPRIDTTDMEAIRAYVRELPVLLRRTAGGNTPCIQVQAGEDTLILDAGSGLRELGYELMKGPCGRGQGIVHILISHCHWDHIQGFTMFPPNFVPGNRIRIYGVHDVEAAFENQQNPMNSPIDLEYRYENRDYMRAEIEFIPLQVGQPFYIGHVRISAIHNNHPGDAYSYRLEDQHGVLIYATDVEYKQLDDTSVQIQPHIEFFRNADALIFDAQYTLRQAWQRVDWGHSSAMIGIDLARAAGVKKLILFHHDPTYSDTQLEEMQSTAIAYQAQDTSLPTCDVIVAHEGLELDLTPPSVVALQLLPEDEAAVFTPTSVFDERGVDQLAEQLARLAEQESPASSIIDLSHVETLTTPSLQALVTLREGDAPLVLAAPSEGVRQVIRLGGYQDFFAIYPSVEAALAAVQAREELNLPGQVIKDRYQIQGRVGEGQLGTVLTATDIQTDRPVALKVLYPSFSEETIDRFMRQAQSLIHLDHPNIVKVFEWDKDRGHCFKVEEFVSGPTLEEFLAGRETQLPADQATDVAQDIIQAMEYAHSQGVVHGNLKPQNIFMTDDGAKLSGFGLGRLEESRNLIDAPLLFLTASYLAPEQVLGQPLDARTDLYALGVILYQLFTGHLPFEGSGQEVMQAHLHQAPPAPRDLNAQISLSLEHLILKLMAKNPNERYASAQQVRHILRSLLIGVEDATRQLGKALVGREEPLQILRAGWEEACVGRGQLAFITGEQGIGKTSLAQQVATESQPPVLLVGHCQELQGGPAYHLFTDVLRDYFATVPPELTDERVHQLLSNFAHLVPEIRQMLPDLPDPPPLEPQQEQLRLMTSLTQFIKQATQERPWLLILDDLQWADQSSLELLRYLGRHLPSMALMIIGIYSEAELNRDHPLLETLRDLRSHPAYRHIPLDRLDQETVGQVLANIWQQSVPEVLVEKIYQHTEGNPFYVEEVAKGLSDDGLVTLQEGEWRFPALEEVRLPQTVREVVWRRIRHLSPDTQALLRQAAVLGQTFKFDDLQEISGLSEWEVLEQLDMALERQLVQEVSGDTMLRFSHPEIHYVLYGELGPLRRRLLHRQAGEALERRAMPEPQRIAEELAHHFREAGELERALIYSLHAARQTEASYANEAALLWYNRTLEMLDQLSPEEVTRIEEMHDFRSLRASAYQSLGDVLSLTGQYDEALAHYASARVLVEAGMTSAEQGRRLANLCLQTADVHDKRSEYFNALTWLDKGLGYLDEDEPTIEAAHIYLLRAEIYRRQGKNEEAIDWCQRSLDIASQIKTREGQQAMGHAYYALGATHWRRGDLERAVQFCRESVRVYRKIDDLVGQSNAYNHLANVYHDRGEWAQASDAHNRNLAIRQEIGDIYGEGLATHNLAGIYLDSGEWSRAAELYEQSLDIWTQVGAILPEATTLSNLAQVYIYQESWSEAHAHLSRSQALFVEIGSEEYLAELDRRWGEYYLGTGELDLAMAHTRRSIELAVVQGNPLDEGVSCRMLGLVHLARGEMEPAEAVLHQSLQILSDLNSEYEAARTRLALARLAIETGSTDEVETYLTPAIKTFERLGARADLAKARELEGRL